MTTSYITTLYSLYRLIRRIVKLANMLSATFEVTTYTSTVGRGQECALCEEGSAALKGSRIIICCHGEHVNRTRRSSQCSERYTGVKKPWLKTVAHLEEADSAQVNVSSCYETSSDCRREAENMLVPTGTRCSDSTFHQMNALAKLMGTTLSENVFAQAVPIALKATTSSVEPAPVTENHFLRLSPIINPKPIPILCSPSTSQILSLDKIYTGHTVLQGGGSSHQGDTYNITINIIHRPARSHRHRRSARQSSRNTRILAHTFARLMNSNLEPG